MTSKVIEHHHGYGFNLREMSRALRHSFFAHLFAHRAYRLSRGRHVKLLHIATGVADRHSSRQLATIAGSRARARTRACGGLGQLDEHVEGNHRDRQGSKRSGPGTDVARARCFTHVARGIDTST
jgi:hypothetical protein